MSAKQEAVREIRTLAKTFKGLIALADELEDIGSIEAAAKEADNRLSGAQAREKEAAERLEKALAEVASAKKEAEAIVTSARRTAEQVKTLARQEADKAIGEANAAARGILAEAAKKKADLEALAADQAKKVEKLGDVIVARQATLDGLNAQLDQIRQKVGA